MPTQKLRVTKKQAIMKEIRKTNPELPEVYIRRELYKVTNKDYQQKDISSTTWLKARGIAQCCQCRAWDSIKNKYKICPVCMQHKEDIANQKFPIIKDGALNRSALFIKICWGDKSKFQ